MAIPTATEVASGIRPEHAAQARVWAGAYRGQLLASRAKLAKHRDNGGTLLNGRELRTLCARIAVLDSAVVMADAWADAMK